MSLYKTCFVFSTLLGAAACGGGAEELPLLDGGNFFGSDATTSLEAGAIAIDAAVLVDSASVALDTGVADASLATEAGADASPRDANASDATALDAGTNDAAPGDANAANDGSAAGDGTTPDATTATGVCGGKTPHGCWPPKAGNPMGCPAQIHEQSEFYPPFEEWEACSSPFYTACLYLKPDGGEGNCSCDLGVHWLCTY